ncbi:MAG: CoA-transferase [Lautropia sp.]
MTIMREERLICALARELHGCRHVAVGSAAPAHAAAALLAACTASDRVRVTILGSRDDNFFSEGGRELFDAAMTGRIDGFVLGGGQIDGHGNVNLLGVGSYPKLAVRWPGNFGAPVMCAAAQRVVLFREEHSPRVFVKQVDFVSVPGTSAPGAWRRSGPHALVTGAGVFGFDGARRRFVLRHLLPGETGDSIRAKTGFEFDVDPAISSLPPPTERELHYLRGEIAARIAPVYPEFVRRVFGVSASSAAATAGTGRTQ